MRSVPLLLTLTVFAIMVMAGLSTPAFAYQLEDEVVDEADIEETDAAPEEEAPVVEEAGDEEEAVPASAAAPAAGPVQNVQEDVALPAVPENDAQLNPPWSAAPKDAPGQVTVETGDTLWDICAKFLGNSWFWPKVWKINLHLPNPHWIYPGNIVRLLPTAAEVAQTSGPAVPASQGAAINTGAGVEFDITDENTERNIMAIESIEDSSVEEDSGEVYQMGGLSRRDIYTKILNSLSKSNTFRREGFVSAKDLKASGKITNSPLEHHYLTKGNKVYLDLEKKPSAVGSPYQIYRIEGEVEHPESGDLVGYKVRILGKLVLSSIGDNPLTGTIVESYSEITRGDLVRPWKDPYRRMERRQNTKNVTGYIIDQLGDSFYLSQLAMVYLDKGLNDGVQEGNTLVVTRRGDGLTFTNYDSPYENEELPKEDVAQCVVLSAGTNTASAVVIKSSLEIKAGDTFEIRTGQ